MIIQIYFDSNLFQLDISNCKTVKDIKVLISNKYSLSVIDQKLKFQQKELTDDQEISSLGIANNDIIELHSIMVEKKLNCFKIIASTPVEEFHDLYQNDNSFKDDLHTLFPQIVPFVQSNDIKGIVKHLASIIMFSYVDHWKQEERERLLERSSADETDPELQKIIYDKIRRNAIMRTGDAMMDSAPLHIYLETTINNVQVNFVVDTGAQTTCISEEVAQKTSISRVVNDNIKTEVRGVGSGTSVGFVHSFDICIGGEYFPVHCQVMPMSTLGGVCLLGLDFLKKYKGIINLVENSLSLELGEKKVVVPLIEGHNFQTIGKLQEVTDEMEVEEDGEEEELSDLVLETANRLEMMGFPKEKALLASKQSNGDIDTALSILENMLCVCFIITFVIFLLLSFFV